MSWASERLAWLSNRYSYRDINEATGIPISTISYVVRGERELLQQYYGDLRKYYSRTVYAALRANGISREIASNYRNSPPARVDDLLSRATQAVERLAQYRLPKYEKYRRSIGDTSSGEQILDRLRQSIREAMAKHRAITGEDYGQDSPTLRHIL